MLHSLGCVEGGEHVRPLPCAHGAGAGQQEHRRVVPVRKKFGKRGEAFEQTFRKEPVKLPTDGHVREGRRSLPQCGPLFKLDKNRGTKLVEPTPKKLIATAVSLLEGANVFRQSEKRRLVKAGWRRGNRGLSRGDGVDGTDTDGKQELAGVWHEPGGKLLVFGNPKVTVELRPYFGTGLSLHGGGVGRELGIHNQLEFGALRRTDRLVVDRHRLGNGHPVAVLLDDVEHPAAERLSDRCAGEHREEVAAAQGEDAGLGEEVSRGAHFGHVDDFNQLRHFWGEFIGISIVQPRYFSVIRIPQGTGKF